MVMMHDHLQLRDSVGISPTSLPRGTFDLTAFARARHENFVARDLMWGPWTMPRNGRSARRSRQLVVIAILIAIIVVSVIFAAPVHRLAQLESWHCPTVHARGNASVMHGDARCRARLRTSTASVDAQQRVLRVVGTQIVSLTNSSTEYAAANCCGSTSSTTSSFSARSVATTAARYSRPLGVNVHHSTSGVLRRGRHPRVAALDESADHLSRALTREAERHAETPERHVPTAQRTQHQRITSPVVLESQGAETLGHRPNPALARHGQEVAEEQFGTGSGVIHPP